MAENTNGWLEIPVIIKAMDFVLGPDAIEKIKANKAGTTDKSAPGTDDTSKKTDASELKQIFGKLTGMRLDSDGNFKPEDKLGLGSKAFGGASDGIVKLLKTSVGLIEDIYKKLVSASPLLQAVESLFNLAMQLFFMPLGNKLAEEFIPAALDMIDDVMEMWDSMEGMSLGEILDTTLDKFTEIFVGYLRNIGTRLEKHGGLLGAIGSMINAIATFGERFLPLIITVSTNILTFIMQNIPLLIGTIVAFKVLSTALQVAQIAASLGSAGGVVGALVGGVAVAAILGTIAATSVTSFADGGYVPYSSGGKFINISEEEGEWIVPDSKMDDFITNQSATRNLKVNSLANSDNGHYTINVYGYTDHELSGIIEDKVNEMSNRSRLRSGY